MAISYEEIDFHKFIQDLSACCPDQSLCSSCSNSECIIAYAQKCITSCLKNHVAYVEQDASCIPCTDMKLYDELDLATGIAHILQTCRSCGKDHYDQCIISIIRNCYEIGLMGETLPYHGSNFRYLNAIHNINPDMATDIIREFHNTPPAQEAQT